MRVKHRVAPLNTHAKVVYYQNEVSNITAQAQDLKKPSLHAPCGSDD